MEGVRLRSHSIPALARSRFGLVAPSLADASAAKTRSEEHSSTLIRIAIALLRLATIRCDWVRLAFLFNQRRGGSQQIACTSGRREANPLTLAHAVAGCERTGGEEH